MQEELADESQAEKGLFVVKEWLKRMPKEDRAAYVRQVYESEQLPGPPPFSYKKTYPQHSSFLYKTYKLHYQFRQNTAQPKAVLIMFHGMGSYAANGGYFGNTICQSIPEINVYAFDQLNFGQSGGPYRGLIESLDDSVMQGQTFLDFLLAKFQSKPKIFLGGSSYGGSICLKMSLISPEKYAGVILLAPAIKKGLNATGFMPGLAKVLTFFLPPLRLFKQSDFNMGSRYNNKVAMLADKLNYNEGQVPHTAATVIHTMDELNKVLYKVTVPYIAFQGTGDKMVDLFGPLDLEQYSASRDKTTIYLQGMWHNVHNEQEIVVIAKEAANWLRERL